MKYIAETERLRLREFTVDDAPFLLELLNTPGWLQFIGDRGVRTIEDAKMYAEKKLISSYARFGYGLYCVETKDTRKPIGMCGLVRRDALENADVGFAFLPDWSRAGYALEATTAVLLFAKKKIRNKKLLAITQADNDRSIRLLTKLGFTFEKTTILPGEDQTLMLYSNDLRSLKS